LASGRFATLERSRNPLVTVLPMHGKHKELGTGFVQKIKKDLGL
jgi:hypothetical protein